MDDAKIQSRRWVILGVLVLSILVVILDNTILNVALKTIQEDLHASQGQMQWAVDSYALVFAGMLITAGVLGDRLGRKKVLLFGLLAFGTTSAMCSFAGSSTELILFRSLMGIGAATVQPQTLSIIQNVFKPAERPKAIGIWAGASGAALALGPVTGGLLLKYFWWGSIFLVNVPIVIVGVIAVFFLVPDSKDPKPGRLDPFGVLLSMVALVVLVYGVIQGGESNHWLGWNTLGLIVLGLALLAIFVRIQQRSSHPTIDVNLFANRHFTSAATAVSATFFTNTGSTFYLVYFLQAVRGYTPLAAGAALAASAGAIMITAPLSARLSARLGPRIVAGAGLTILGLAMGSFSIATQTMPQWVTEMMMFGQGTGMGLTMSPATNAIMGAVPRDRAGAGSAVNTTVRQVAAALGVAILGSVLAVAFRSHLGTGAPAALARRLDQPAAVAAALPPSARVSAFVGSDTSQSIGNALTFTQDAERALRARAALTEPAGRTAAQQAARIRAGDQAETAIGAFVAESKSSFISAMHMTALFAGLAALLGAVVAFLFMPSKREFAAMTQAGASSASAEAAMAHQTVR